MFKIFDLHNDYILKLRKFRKNRYVAKNNIKNHNIISAVWTSELNIYESMSEIKNAKSYINLHKHLLLAVEDLHFLNKENLDEFLMVRPAYAGLTWNNTNALAGGAHEFGNLTKFGRTVVRKMESHGIKIDTAHLNEESFMDISKITTQPFFCSHTAFFGVHQDSRNLKDYQIKMIIDSGGVVGLCLVSDFINGTKRCLIDDVAMHIDYFACKFGLNNLALGTDFYGTNHLPKNTKDYDDLTDKLSRKLIKMGYTEKSLNKIFYDNAEKFFA